MNIELAIKAVQIKPELYYNLPRSTKEDVSFTLKILETCQDVDIFESIPFCIRDNIEIAEYLIKSRYFYAYKYMSYRIRNNLDFVNKNICYDVFIYAGDDVKANRETVLRAVQNNGDCIEYAGKYKYDREIVNAAVKRSCYSLEYIPDEMKYDRNMIIEAIKNGASINHIPSKFMNDEEIAKLYFEHNDNIHKYTPLKYFSQHYNLLKVKYSDDILKHIPDSLLNNREFILDLDFIVYRRKLPPTITRNKPLFNALINKYPQLLHHTANTSMSGKEFMGRFPHIKLYAIKSKGHCDFSIRLIVSRTKHNVVLYHDSTITFEYCKIVVNKCLII